MSNIIQTTTELAIHMASGYAKKGGVFADATCGNGHDTLRLAKMGPSKLYAFDIQSDAIENTRRLLISEGFGPQLKDGTIELIRDSHENMRDHIGKSAHTAAPVDVIIFNLGYLPGGDKHITTGESSTRKAAEASLTLLAKDGLLCITMYSGHPEGQREKEALLGMASALDPRTYHSAYVNMLNQRNEPPELLLITKKTSGR